MKLVSHKVLEKDGVTRHKADLRLAGVYTKVLQTDRDAADGRVNISMDNMVSQYELPENFDLQDDGYGGNDSSGDDDRVEREAEAHANRARRPPTRLADLHVGRFMSVALILILISTAM